MTPDDQIHAFFQSHHDPGLDVILAAMTHLGDVTLQTIAAILTLLALWWRRRRDAIRFVCIVLAALGTSEAGKAIIARPRPSVFRVVERPDSPSMPSGHAIHSIAITLLALERLGGARFVPIGIVLAIGIGFSRVYFGVHWASDVLVGWMIGGAAVWSISRLFNVFSRKESDGVSAQGSRRWPGIDDC